MLNVTILKLAMSLAGTYLSLVAPDPNANACEWVETDPKVYFFEIYLKTEKVDETGDFTWKDPQAAAHAGMDLREWLFDGLEQDTLVRVYWMARTLDYFGYEPGITSAFRDDYRQSLIAKGMKARVGYSFHGGSLRGGFGRGRAMDLVSLGATREEVLRKNEKFFPAIDRWGKLFGLGRPYGKRDAGHVAPLTSPEFAIAAHLHQGRTRLAHRHHHHRVTHKKTRVAGK